MEVDIAAVLSPQLDNLNRPDLDAEHTYYAMGGIKPQECLRLALDVLLKSCSACFLCRNRTLCAPIKALRSKPRLLSTRTTPSKSVPHVGSWEAGTTVAAVVLTALLRRPTPNRKTYRR